MAFARCPYSVSLLFSTQHESADPVGHTRKRLANDPEFATPEELLQENPYTLPERLVQAIIDNDEQLREWIVSILATMTVCKLTHACPLSRR